MATITISPTSLAPAAPAATGPLATLIGRRFALSARTPRELVVPLMTPVLFALVITPALAKIGPRVPGLDYMSFAAVGTAVLLIPLNTMFAGVGVITDRDSGARRDLLAAPIPRTLVVVANLIVALAVTALQVVVLIVAAVLRGAVLHVTTAGALWFVLAALFLGIGMYGVAETLATKMAAVEEYIAAVPGLAIVPFFFAGSLFPIKALPWFLADVARVLPVTHALALMRYGLLGHNSTGLHDIWGMHSATAMAGLSLAVVIAFAALMLAVAIRMFQRSAVS